jgi:hypothetical protein
MKVKRGVSHGWSFVIGMVLGALAVLAFTNPIAVPRVTSEEREHASAAISGGDPPSFPSSELRDSNPKLSASPLAAKKPRRREAPGHAPRHAECELQLD